MRGWGAEDGLPVAVVNTMTQTPDGYLWVGAEEGLTRFDGVRFTTYDQGSQPPLENRVVTVLATDPGGRLVIGGTAGVSRRGEEGFTPLAPGTDLGQATVYSLFPDREGNLWVGTSKRLRCFRDGREVQQAATSALPEGIYRLAQDAAGEVWAASDHVVYALRGGAFLAQGTLGEADGVPALSTSRTGGVWVGTKDRTGRWRGDRLEAVPALDGVRAQCLHEDRAGTLWLGTAGRGLLRWDARRGEVSRYTTADGLRGDIVLAIHEDREGNLWVGTNGGLQVFSEPKFTVFGRPEGLADDVVHAVFRDAAGQLWVGTNAGVSALGGPAGRPPVNYPLPGDPSSLVMSFGSGEGAGGGLLVGAYVGLRRFREGRVEPAGTGVADLESRRVYAVCPDGEGGVWVACYNGVYRLRDGGAASVPLGAANGLAGKAANVLHVDRRGALWMGTDTGLTRRDPDGRLTEFGPADGLGGTYVVAIHEDARGDLFVGTIGGGLTRLRGGKFTNYTTRQGLFDDTTFSILEDDAGRLWLGGNRGIWNVAKADLERLDRHEITRLPTVAYGTADGLRTRECNGGSQPCAWRDADGTMWWATAKGLASLHPARVTTNPLPPPVRIEEVTAGPGEVSRGSGGGAVDLAADTRKFEVAYTALSLTAPEANRFRYRLDGFDRGWNEAGTARVAHYTNLAPGRYTFRVQAANADGAWNEAGATLGLTLHPRWDQTLGFRVLLAILALGGAWTGAWAWRRRVVLRLARAEARNRERARTEEILRAAMAEAERANAAKSEFLSRVSHELRTPLNAILGFGQLLEMEPLSQSQNEGVEQILGGGRHLLGLVEEILDLAHIERGEAVVHPEPLDPATVLAEAVALVQPLARERGVSLRAEAPAEADGGVRLLADPRRLRQVLLNLLANAVKYNRPVGGEVVIGSGTSGADRRRITVRDTGAGIGEAGLARLFTPFERLGAAYGPIEGTGLGLAVSRQLVEAMGGTLGVESTPGVGSTFWVDLPSAPASDPAAHGEGQPGGAPPAPARADEDSRAPGPGGGEVLYIEDNAPNRQLVECVLAQHRPDLRLRCAPDGHAGLRHAGMEPRPDLILLDLQLPDLPGEDVLTRLRADAHTAGLPVVVLSADATAGSQRRLRSAGAVEYLLKPLEIRKLVEVLGVFCPVRPPRPAVTGAEAAESPTPLAWSGPRREGPLALP